MRTTRLLLLTGTVLPALLTGQTAAALGSGPHDAIVIAQGGPGMEREPRGGGGEGPRGGGEGPRGGARPERAAPERAPAERAAPPAARERPEPRPAPAQERAPAREPVERAAPPAPRERPPVERPAPAPRQEAPRPPTPAPERPAPPVARERAPEPAEQPARRAPPPAETAPQRAAPPPPAAPRPAPEPARPVPLPNAGEKTAPNAAPGTPGKPVQRPDAAPPAPPPAPPGKVAPPAGIEPQPGAGERGTGQRGRQPGQNPPGAAQPGAVQPPAPNAAPGVPGKPVQAPANPPPGTPPDPGGKQGPNAPAPQPGAPAPKTPPNMQPGVPGRPVGQPPGAGPNGQVPGAYPPNGGPGGPGRPGGPGAGVQPGYGAGAPGPGGQPGYAPGQPGGVPAGRVDDRGVGFNRPGRPGYVPGGFRDDDEDVRDYSRIQRDRREYNEDGRTYIREPGRIIVQDRGGYFIRHDENERFRDLDRRAFRSERRGADTYTYLDRPGGEQIVTVVDDDGRMLRRYRRFRDGREVMIIDNGYGAGPRRAIYEDVVELPPPDIRIPRDRYIVNYEGADERSVYEALAAPPVVALDRRYTLDQVRNSPQLRARMRSVDIDTINFDTGSFTVTNDQAQRLSTIAAAINQAVRANPQEVFLIEGYTDAVGTDVDNLSLSDRRAQSVATVLTQTFQVPPENLTTQGYGEQYLKVNTQGPSRENRRVTVRRITPLIQQGQAQGLGVPAPSPGPR